MSILEFVTKQKKKLAFYSYVLNAYKQPKKLIKPLFTNCIIIKLFKTKLKHLFVLVLHTKLK